MKSEWDKHQGNQKEASKSYREIEQEIFNNIHKEIGDLPFVSKLKESSKMTHTHRSRFRRWLRNIQNNGWWFRLKSHEGGGFERYGSIFCPYSKPRSRLYWFINEENEPGINLPKKGILRLETGQAQTLNLPIRDDWKTTHVYDNNGKLIGYRYSSKDNTQWYEITRLTKEAVQKLELPMAVNNFVPMLKGQEDLIKIAMDYSRF